MSQRNWKLYLAVNSAFQEAGSTPVSYESPMFKAIEKHIGTLIASPAQPTRTLREYKGVTYRDWRWWFNTLPYDKASSLISHWGTLFTDADHAAILALKDDPYEPVETVEDVLREVARVAMEHEAVEYAARIRAAVHAEGAR